MQVLNSLKNTLLISLLIFAGCGISRQSIFIKRIDGVALEIDKEAELKMNTFNLNEYFKEDGDFVVSKLNSELKRVSIYSERYGYKINTIIYFENKLPILIRQHEEAKATFRYFDKVETKITIKDADFYIKDWNQQIYQKVTPKGYKGVFVEKEFKKENIDKIIQIADTL